MTIFSDKTLSQKLERTEARTSADFIELRAVLFPQINAECVKI